jgi:hypothetical protein
MKFAFHTAPYLQKIRIKPIAAKEVNEPTLLAAVGKVGLNP